MIRKNGQNTIVRLRHGSVEFLARLLVDLGDYWSYSALMDLNTDYYFKQKPRDISTKFKLREILKEKRLEPRSYLFDAWIAVRKVIATLPRAFYSITCGNLLSADHKFRKLPF